MEGFGTDAVIYIRVSISEIKTVFHPLKDIYLFSLLLLLLLQNFILSPFRCFAFFVNYDILHSFYCNAKNNSHHSNMGLKNIVLQE